MKVVGKWLWEFKMEIIGYLAVALSQAANAGLFEEIAVKWMMLGSGLLTLAGAHTQRYLENRRKANVLPPPEQG